MTAVMLALLIAFFRPTILPDPPACRCAAVEQTIGWCRACDVGFVAGVRIESAVLYEALDDHGHEVSPRALECSGCRLADATNRICGSCEWGFVDHHIHASRLTYFVALAERDSSSEDAIGAAHQAGADDRGWCVQCDAGHLGDLRFRDEEVHRDAVLELDHLERSMTNLPRCETCVLASYFGSFCPECNLDYRSRERVK